MCVGQRLKLEDSSIPLHFVSLRHRLLGLEVRQTPSVGAKFTDVLHYTQLFMWELRI